MIPLVALVAAALAAPAASTPPSAARLPFPAPRLAQVTDATKCDAGTVLAVDAAHGRLQGMTSAGPVTYVVGPDVQVFSSDGKPAGGVAAVTVGARYRAYYVLDGGARVQEIDLE
jgi:hypothetical protein